MRSLILSTVSTLALLIYPLSVSAQSSFSLSLDVNGAAGDQSVTSLNTSADQVVAIQIFGTNIQNANALAVRFEYDANQVTYEGFEVGSVLPSAQALPEHGANPTFVEIGIASLGGQATANSGLMGTIRFRTTAAFSGTSIRLARAELSRGGRFETITPNMRVELQTPPAPTNFSLSLDVDGTAGDQAVTSLNTSADQAVAIQIFGTDIQNANGVSVRFEYDASQLTYDGFDVGSVLPSAQALPEHGTNPTFVEIGIASLGGQATANSGLIGTIRFRTTATFSGTAIRLVRAELSRGGRFETLTPNLRVELQTPPAPTNFSLSLDVDGTAGDQAVTSLNTSADQVVAIQIFGTDIQNANGVSVRFEYDASQVTYDGFDPGNVLLSAQALPEQGTGFVQIGIVSFGGQATANSGLVGTIRFRTTAAFSGASIRLVRAELGRGGRFETITPNVHVDLQLQALTPDFDGDGRVGFSDFLLFGSQFGARQGDGRYEARFDLDSDGAIGFGDFLIFGSDFGKEVSSGGSSGGSGGGSGSPDLIVESSSVSDSTLTAGQSFTLRATVRNQGSGQSATTTLRYYQSSDATITVNDTQVGTDAVGSLNASGTSAESISLNAPSSAGTYYYGACVESVSGEPEIDNNCSAAVRVSVSGSSGLVAIPDANLRAVIEAALGKTSGASITPAEMATLTSLDAQDKEIRDLTGLEFATNLTRLMLDNNLISDVSMLSNLTKLETLWLLNNLISDLSPLANANLSNIWQISFSRNTISDVSPLANLTSLNRLDLNGNLISDVSVLSNLTSLTSLYLDGNLISDVSVLSNLTSLTSLGLDDNLVSDVSVLSNLTKMRQLSLSNNPVRGADVVSLVSGMTKLTYLRLNRCSISDVSALAGLTSMELLELAGNTITDISPLAGMTNLTYLYLGSNLISNTSALAGLTSMELLELAGNIITDISPLAGMTNLTYLYLNSNLISDVSALAGMTNLETLRLNDNVVSEVSALAGATNLTSLYLNENLISDVSALSGMTNLETLGLSNNLISEVSALAGMTNLTNLSLTNNVISDASPLAGLTNLTYLSLYNNAVLNISPLSGLTNLTELWLYSNAFSDISPLSGLTNLTELDLQSNGISDISILSGLTNLKRLHLYDNAISNISSLSGLIDLEFLRIEANLISDLAPLVANTGLGSGDVVNVKDNPLSDTSLNTHIPALQARGVNVLFGALKPTVVEKETRMPPKPVVKENERRMPRVAMKQFGFGEREEVEYMSRRQMEMRQDMISRKMSLRDKARREEK